MDPNTKKNKIFRHFKNVANGLLSTGPTPSSFCRHGHARIKPMGCATLNLPTIRVDFLIA